MKPIGDSIEVAISGRKTVETFTVSNPLIWTTLALAANLGRERTQKEEQAGHDLNFRAGTSEVQ